MSWLSNLTPPGIKNIFKREDDGADALWHKCSNCGEMIFHRDLESTQRVCPSCGFHMTISVAERLQSFSMTASLKSWNCRSRPLIR